VANVIKQCPLHAALCATLLLSGGAALAQPAQSDPARWLMCAGTPLFDWLAPGPAQPGDRERAGTDLDAARIDVSGKDVYRLEGDVALQRADQRLLAERIDYTHSTSAFSAGGGIRYQDRDIALSAASAQGVLNEDRTRLDDVRYQLIGLRGHGQAAQAELLGPLSELDQVDYTTCDPADIDWQFRARELQLDHDAGIGRVRDATLRIGDVPVLWLPYARFPIDDRRQSGFLYPTVGSDGEGGLDLRIPYYLNLAPNYDATLETRIIGHRGVMLGGEFRFLGARQEGIVEGDWLADDDETGRDRGRFRLRHGARLNPTWSLATDLHHVSDDRYFEDFGDSLTTTSTSLIESRTGLIGRGRWWNASVGAQAWDITDPTIPDSAEPFRRLPRALFDWRQPLLDSLEVGFRGEAVAFDHSERADGQRLDLRPFIATPLERAWGYVRPEFAWRHTSYRLDGDFRDAGFTDRDPSRSTPIASLDAALLFERPASLFGTAMLQTLQPRLFYLNVPYEDQSDLPIFDTQELSFGFDQLFRPNRFSGADRQADADQLTIALTSRWFEAANGRERLAASLGQIRYFDPQRVQLPGLPATDFDGSAYVGELDFSINEHWRLGLVQHWDPEIDHSTLAGVRAQWRGSSGALANLSYRYRRAVLEQIDSSFAVPLGGAWRLIGRWNYSLLDESTLEALGGVEWEGCCIAARVVGRHFVRNREGDTNNAIYFELELKGLASFGRRTGEFLQRAILGYSQAP